MSKHLKVLERAGLITRGRTAQLRPSRIEGGPLRDVAVWLKQYRAIWEGRLDRLVLHLGKSNERQMAMPEQFVMAERTIVIERELDAPRELGHRQELKPLAPTCRSRS